MKITDLRMETYRWPRDKPIRNGLHVYATAGLNVIKIDTDEGITGVGLGGVQEAEDIGRSIAEHFKQYVVGRDPFDTERIWDDMWVPKLVGRRGITTRVISAIDIALWDVKGKATGQPLYKLLGGYTDKIPVYIAGGYYEEGKGLEELALETEESVSTGARAVKMKIGGVRRLLVRGAGAARRLPRSSAHHPGNVYTDRHRRERVHPLRLPGPDR